MKRLFLLSALFAMLVPVISAAQVPRTVLAEMCSATW